jgi:hypothetical protein
LKPQQLHELKQSGEAAQQQPTPTSPAENEVVQENKQQ